MLLNNCKTIDRLLLPFPKKAPYLATGRDTALSPRMPKRVLQVYGCVVNCQDMVEQNDPTKNLINLTSMHIQNTTTPLS